MDAAVLPTNLGMLTGVLQQLCQLFVLKMVWRCLHTFIGHSGGCQGRHYGYHETYQQQPKVWEGQVIVLSDTLDESCLNGRQGDLRWICTSLGEGLWNNLKQRRWETEERYDKSPN